MLNTLDPKSMIDAYLGHIKVSTKNDTGQTFSVSLQVFVDKKQTPIGPQATPTPAASFNDLRKRLQDVCTMYEQVKKNCVPEKRYFFFIITVLPTMYPKSNQPSNILFTCYSGWRRGTLCV